MQEYIVAEIIRRLPENRRPTVAPSDILRKCMDHPRAHHKADDEACIAATVERLEGLADPAASVRITNIFVSWASWSWQPNTEDGRQASKDFHTARKSLEDALSADERATWSELNRVLYSYAAAPHMNDHIFAEILRQLPADRQPSVELSAATKRWMTGNSSILKPGEVKRAQVVASHIWALTDSASAVRVLNRLAHGMAARMFQWRNPQEAIAQAAYDKKAADIIGSMSADELALSDKLSKVLWGPTDP